MALVGLKYLAVAKVGANGAATDGRILAKLITASINITSNDVKQYADDEVAESDSSFASGNIALSVNDLSQENLAFIRGNTVNVNGELVANKDDIAPYLLTGFFAPKRINNTKKFRAFVFGKTQAAEPNDTLNTKAETIQFGAPSLTLGIYTNDTGDWKTEKTFDTEADAKAWINQKLGISGQCQDPVASVAAGSYDATQSVELTAGTSESIYYTTNGIEPTATTGTLYSSAISIAESCALKAISIRTGYQSSNVVTLEYFIA